MESAAVLKRGVGYEMSRLGHYLTQVGYCVIHVESTAAAAASLSLI